MQVDESLNMRIEPYDWVGLHTEPTAYTGYTEHMEHAEHTEYTENTGHTEYTESGVIYVT